MKLPNKKFQYALVDAEYNFHYLDNGIVKKQQYLAFMRTPFHPFLPQHPAEWKAFQVSFEMNEKYWLSKRSYSVPLTFVGDGGTIIRDRMINGKGYSEELYLLLLIYNDTTGAYDLECKLQIDFTQYSDDPFIGAKVNAIEGGVLAILSSKDTTTYELLCDETNPAIVRVFDDGISLQDTYNFIELGVDDIDGARHIVSMAFINNTGDSIGVEYGNPSFEFVSGTGYYASSSNYLLKSLIEAVSFRIYKVFKYGGMNTDGLPGVYHLRYVISDATAIISQGDLGIHSFTESSFEIPIDFSFTLQPGQKIFIEGLNLFTDGVTNGGLIRYLQSDIAVDFGSRNVASEFFALRPLDAWKQLVSLMTEGKYTGDSVYLAEHDNIVLTCGDALRNTSRLVVVNYKMAMSVEDFFISYSSIYNLGLKAVNNVLFIEPKNTLFKPDTEIFDLGEVNDLKIDCANQYLANLFKCGYPDQNYDSTSASVSGGKYETNSGQEWTLPTSTISRTLDITSRFRADSRGIEAIRGGLLNKDTTDNQGDKEVFMVNISDAILSESFIATQADEQSFVGAQFVPFGFYVGLNFAWNNPEQTEIIFTGDYQVANIEVFLYINYGGKTVICSLYKNGGSSIAITTSNDTVDGTTAIIISAPNIPLATGDVFTIYVVPFETPTDWILKSAVFRADLILTTYTLRRASYTSITGVLDNSVYNIEELTPHRQLLAWMPYLASLFYQQPTDKISLSFANKNTALITTLAGVTISESADEIIGNYVGLALFIPYLLRFTTKIPKTFEQLSQMGTGYIKLSSNGIAVYGLPFGKLVSKPGTQEAQEWLLLSAPNNTIIDFLKLGTFGLLLSTGGNNIMFISDYNPVQWVRYAFTPQAKYHHLDMYDDWSYNRFDRYYAKPVYFQKWQTSDTIKMQFLVSGIPGLNLFIYDCAGNEYYNTALTATSNTALDGSLFTLYQAQISLASFASNRYLFVIKSAAGQNLAISEWQDIKVNHPKTYLAEYSNTYNKPYMYFNSIGQMMMRFEGILAIPEPDSDSYSFVDEPEDAEILNAVPFERQKLMIGDPYGVPDWMGKKINLITLLNEMLIEGKEFTRNPDAKLGSIFRSGFKYNVYSIELRPSRNLLGMEVIATEEETDEDVTSYMLNQQAIGMNGEGTLDVEITNT